MRSLLRPSPDSWPCNYNLHRAPTPPWSSRLAVAKNIHSVESMPFDSTDFQYYLAAEILHPCKLSCKTLSKTARHFNLTLLSLSFVDSAVNHIIHETFVASMSWPRHPQHFLWRYSVVVVKFLSQFHQDFGKYFLPVTILFCFVDSYML